MATRQTPEPGATYYGPCGRCEKHWTRKASATERGVCRFCLDVLKTKFRQSH
jgi:hypothetical protein